MHTNIIVHSKHCVFVLFKEVCEQVGDAESEPRIAGYKDGKGRVDQPRAEDSSITTP